MNEPSNLARARSHIIFIVGLLAAASYILWVERGRGVPSEAPRPEQAAPVAPAPLAQAAPEAAPPVTAWRVQLGAFSSAEEAGRQWDGLRRSIPGLGALSVTFEPSGELVRLQVGPLTDRQQVERLCASVRTADVPCAAVPPLTPQP
jgi:cell division septation protein DedD